MVIECPKCSTTFQLPVERMSAKGSKVRCSKCSHTFRVRLTGDGEAEVFYKNEGVADPPTQDLSDLFEESVADSLDDVFPGVKGKPMPAEEDGFDPRSTMIGLPVSERKSKSAAPDYNPFPFASAMTPPPALEEPSIDLFDGEDPSVVSVAEEDPDPFAGAFQQASSIDDESAIPKQLPSRAHHGTPMGGPVAPLPKPKFDIESAPVPKAAPRMATLPEVPEPAEQHVDPNAMFGSAEDLVDPNFGHDSPSFDPNSGRVVAPPAAAQAPPQAVAPQRVAPAAAPNRPQDLQSSGPPKKAAVVDDLDFEPHRVGGGGFQKFSNFLFILLIAVACVLGFVAFKSGGVLDFARIDHMLEVGFQGKTFEARPEWIPEPVAPPVPEVPAIEVQDVFARLVPIGRRDQILVVSGVAFNSSDSEVSEAKIRVMITDETQKVLRESTVSAGRQIPFADISGAKSIEDLRGLSPDSAKAVSSNGIQPVQSIIFDVPQTVLDGGAFGVKVEVVSP